ncbi:protein shisa-like-2A [Oncorhynchus keta]|uniref:protein shisa-like-2A n=1 Tax=Oncorhynchus keta TaxID=8018 RepID=UPI00227CC93A|nr:protein shisa-like-2A [Oncorhynchus keta]
MHNTFQQSKGHVCGRNWKETLALTSKEIISRSFLPESVFSTSMSAECTSYYSADNVFVNGSSCPKAEGDARAAFCCGFNDIKYCCDDPNSFFPYEYGYMWWLSVGALIGLSIAAVVLLAFLITVFVLCYLFISTKPSRLDSGLPLRAPVSIPGLDPSEYPSPSSPSHRRPGLQDALPQQEVGL